MTYALGHYTVKLCEMDEDMAQFAKDTALQANSVFHEHEMATYMKNYFEKQYSSSYWHCIVGK